LGNRFALFNLAQCYLKGIGISRIFSLYTQFIEKSAQEDNSSAFFEYGFLLLNEFLGSNKEMEAVSYFKKSADDQEIEGMFWFGLCLFEGKGIGRDSYKGIEMMEYSRNQEFLPSELYISSIPLYYHSIRY
jgi:TPR repeat protein